MDLMGSNANRAVYEFTNSAKRTREDWRDQKQEKWDEQGVHMSFRVDGHSVNLFVPVEQALRMFLNFRDSLRNVVSELSAEDLIAVQHRIQHDEQMLGFAGRKSNVREDMGLNL